MDVEVQAGASSCKGPHVALKPSEVNSDDYPTAINNSETDVGDFGGSMGARGTGSELGA